ncbi:hypothetical protein [Herpetosiphon geysericola]|uniref:Uncharacterized protein n=1 Tax=Herpetosiphon geysericola TaxID=70996 RepID=A0A0P6YHC9_9CHLR|nr:hypothetical protein [Herpetosiphon geysericola]KPL91628.1 hypothetical protein SE18_01105 [Herpetosiphon geysericola]
MQILTIFDPNQYVINIIAGIDQFKSIRINNLSKDMIMNYQPEPNQANQLGIIYVGIPAVISEMQYLSICHPKFFYILDRDDPLRKQSPLGGERFLPWSIGYFFYLFDRDDKYGIEHRLVTYFFGRG